MRKKTYMLDDHTLDLLEELKRELNQKEVSVIREAVRQLHERHRKEKEYHSMLKDMVSRLDSLAKRIEELSFELGRYKERNSMLERKIKELLTGLDATELDILPSE